MYSCTGCRKFIDNIDLLYFVEENNMKGFCSDECIEVFYKNFVEFFENEELNQRDILNLNEEESTDYVNQQSYTDLVLKYPDKIYVQKNEVNEVQYQLYKKIKISKDKYVHFLVYCLIYEGVPSFVFNIVASSSYKLIEELAFSKSANISILKPNLGEGASEEFSLEVVEQKKSQYLALLIDNNCDQDIQIEDYYSFDEYIEITLKEPDEILYDRDDCSDNIFTFIKALNQNGVAFFYFVICFGVQEDISSGQLTTIISFPTKDAKLHALFRKGKVISGSLIN